VWGSGREAMRIVIVGGSGFIGSHVVTAVRSAAREPVALPSIRVSSADGRAEDEVAEAWPSENRDAFDRLCSDLQGAEVVINAAGMAAPASSDLGALVAANAIQPAVVARACGTAGVRRLVHVSTAAVQGRREPLDETPAHAPASPYAESKAKGERLLLDIGDEGPPEVVIYRPASVHGLGRAVTEKLVRFAGRPVVPLAGAGNQPVPTALIDNVAAGIVFAGLFAPLAPGTQRVIALQPDEGLTARRLIELFGAERLVRLPTALTRRVLAVVDRTAAPSAFLASRARWLDLLWHGQSVRAELLVRAGFASPVGHDGWRSLAEAVRAQAR